MNKKFMIKDLIETDKIFCEECKLDKEKAWNKYLISDSKMVIPNNKETTTGKDDINKLIRNIFDLKNISFIWKPTIGDVSDDLTLGYTMGTYIKKYYVDSKKIVEEGNYLTIWKKVNGKWKISVDFAN